MRHARAQMAPVADGAEDEIYAKARERRRERLALPDNLTPRERLRAPRMKESGETGGGTPSVTNGRTSSPAIAATVPRERQNRRA